MNWGGVTGLAEDGVLAVLREELWGHHPDESEHRDHHGQLENDTEGQGELDHEVRVVRHRDHRLPAFFLAEGHEEVRRVGNDHEHGEGATDQEQKRAHDDEGRGVLLLVRVQARGDELPTW